MNKKRYRKLSLIIGLAAGALADGYLRLISGDEGNLLVHTAVFLGGALIVCASIYGLFCLRHVVFENKKRDIPR